MRAFLLPALALASILTAGFTDPGGCVGPAPDRGGAVACGEGADCPAGFVCDHERYCEPPPGCEPGDACPAVCFGRCVEVSPPPEPAPTFCWTDDECGSDARCDRERFCESPPGCSDGDPCPDVCYGRCVTASTDECWGAWRDRTGQCRSPSDGVYPSECCANGCDDGSEIACRALMPDCDRGLAAVIVDGCWQCVSPENCTSPPACTCTMIHAPVCGADGRTYQNACAARCVGADVVHEGPCRSECICTEEYAPVCGSDGRTYSNECNAHCAGVKVAYPGECREPCVCTREWAPVCGSDGQTYSNACNARCAGAEIVHDGECRQGCECPEVYDPVCGSDGRTYANRCELRCAGVPVRHPGPCGAVCHESSSCRRPDRCLASPDGPGECLPADFCYVPRDCQNLGPVVDCVGSWSCEQHRCRFECSAG